MEKIVPSSYQQSVMDWVRTGRGSAIVRARAGSGKTKLIELSLPGIPESASVQLFAFNKPIGDELKARILKLAEEHKRPFRGFRAGTFHSVALAAVLKRLGRKMNQVKIDGGKVRQLVRDKVIELGGPEYEMYGDFVVKLVAYAKGEGIGCLVSDTDDAWRHIIQHHGMYLDAEEATEERAIEIARRTLQVSIEIANPMDGSMPVIDFDDMLYLTVLWKLRLWQNDFVFVDEAQDTNPVRRAIAKLALRPGGRLVAVGDDRQAIYGFTGATAEAMDLIKHEFDCREFSLPVCYRCSKAAIRRAQQVVSDIVAWDGAPEGEDLTLKLKDALPKLGDHDAVLCRNTAPLLKLAYQLIAGGKSCTVLGRDIGQGLVSLVKKMRGKNLEGMLANLQRWREREIAAAMAKGEEGKAESVSDRAECVTILSDQLAENERTIPALLRKIESLFSDENGRLVLSTIHKAKGREWRTVAILQPELSPSKWARQDWQQLQEQNLIYVRDTRAQMTTITLIP